MHGTLSARCIPVNFHQLYEASIILAPLLLLRVADFESRVDVDLVRREPSKSSELGTPPRLASSLFCCRLVRAAHDSGK